MLLRRRGGINVRGLDPNRCVREQLSEKSHCFNIIDSGTWHDGSDQLSAQTTDRQIWLPRPTAIRVSNDSMIPHYVIYLRLNFHLLARSCTDIFQWIISEEQSLTHLNLKVAFLFRHFPPF